jgi:hypothetical protein
MGGRPLTPLSYDTVARYFHEAVTIETPVEIREQQPVSLLSRVTVLWLVGHVTHGKTNES